MKYVVRIDATGDLKVGTMHVIQTGTLDAHHILSIVLSCRLTPIRKKHDIQYIHFEILPASEFSNWPGQSPAATP